VHMQILFREEPCATFVASHTRSDSCKQCVLSCLGGSTWRVVSTRGGGDKTFLTVLLDTPLGEQPTGNSWLLPPDLHTIRLGEQPTGNSLLLPPDLHTIHLGEQPAGNS